jgi:prepilin-type N-terminal cleavage/methylation domain-containing protein
LKQVRQSGFTYLEIVLTLAIISIVFAGVSLSFLTLYNKWEFASLQQELSLNLQELRLQAIDSGQPGSARIIRGERKIVCQLGGTSAATVFPPSVTVSFTGFNQDGTFWFLPSGAPSPRAGTIILRHGGHSTEMVVNVGTGCVDTSTR